ncbi:hypothetical protein, partial [Enterobacter intestinihominis]
PREAHVQGNTGIRVLPTHANDEDQEDETHNGRWHAALHFKLQRFGLFWRQAATERNLCL